jgi:cytochrome P450
MTMVSTAHGLGGAEFVDGAHQRQLIGTTAVPVDPAVVPVHGPDGGQWLVTGYPETRDFLRDGRFSRAEASEACHPRGPALQMSITEMDPPRHTRIRNIIGGAFSARRVERLRPTIERIAERLLHEAVRCGPVTDLIADFCAPLTFTAHCELLGVPAARRESIGLSSLRRLGTPGAADPTETYHAELLLHAEVTDLLADPDLPPGLLADLVAAHHDRGLLTDTELTGLAASLFFDGHALAAAQIGNAVLCLLTRPALLASLRENPSLLDGVIEESFRYSPSVTLSMARVATEDVTLGEACIRAGDRVTAALPLANRDAAAFEHPQVFEPGRGANRHLSLGYGTHHCIGAHLARVEVRAALGALLRDDVHLELAVPEEQLAWYASPTIRSLTALPVHLSQRPRAPRTHDTGPGA